MPVSMATGQAAGVRAALAASLGKLPQAVPVSDVQIELARQGANLRRYSIKRNSCALQLNGAEYV
jgi:hypothetical protein